MRTPEIVFFGKITAGITHELMNVLAIIKETSGLLKDRIHLAGSETMDREKLLTSISIIEKQVERGVTIISHLNKFAHSPDKEEKKIDLIEMVNETVALSHRYARLKNITLRVHPPDRVMAFTTCQVFLHRVLFSCIEYCISGLPQGAQIDITLHQNERKAYAIKFDCSSNLLDAPDPAYDKQTFDDIEKQINTAPSIHATLQKELDALQLTLLPVA